MEIQCNRSYLNISYSCKSFKNSSVSLYLYDGIFFFWAYLLSYHFNLGSPETCLKKICCFLPKHLMKDGFLTWNNMLILSLLYTLTSRDGNLDRGTWLNGTVIGHAPPKSFLWQDRVLVRPSRATSRADVLSERQSR